MKPIHVIAIFSQVIVAFFISVLFVFVQAPQSKDIIMQRILPRDIAKAETAWMLKELKLTNQQYSQIACINQETAEAIHSIMDTHVAEKSFQQIEKAIVQKEEQLKHIFTAAQWKMYQAKKPLVMQPVRITMQETIK